MEARDFWQRIQSRVEVAVASGASDKALGVRDGFLRYFHEGLDRRVPVAVVPQGDVESAFALAVSDEEAVATALNEVEVLDASLHRYYDFFAAASGGLHSVEVAGLRRHFVHSWVVVRCPAGTAWGSSGSLEIPERVLDGGPPGPHLTGFPGTRRSGGLIASLTGGLESRRRAVASATLHALSSLFYGRLESRSTTRG